MLFLVQKTSQKCWVWNSRRFFAADRKNVIIISRPWKDHFKSDLRSDQDHLLKKDLRSDQDHI
jgi:hypothetical protein